MTKPQLKALFRDQLITELRDDELRQRLKVGVLQRCPDTRPEDCLIDEAREEVLATTVEALLKQ